MSEQKTITESECEKFHREYLRFPGASGSSIRAAFAAIGFSIVPDPIPEPRGDVIVRDHEGNYWTYSSTKQHWTTPAVRGSLLWGELLHERGPVEIYEKRGS